MVHGIESISADSTPKMEGLLNRTVRQGSTILEKHTRKSNPKPIQQYSKPAPIAQSEDYVRIYKIWMVLANIMLGHGY